MKPLNERMNICKACKENDVSGICGDRKIICSACNAFRVKPVNMTWGAYILHTAGAMALGGLLVFIF